MQISTSVFLFCFDLCPCAFCFDSCLVFIPVLSLVYCPILCWLYSPFLHRFWSVFLFISLGPCFSVRLHYAFLVWALVSKFFLVSIFCFLVLTLGCIPGFLNMDHPWLFLPACVLTHTFDNIWTALNKIKADLTQLYPASSPPPCILQWKCFPSRAKQVSKRSLMPVDQQVSFPQHSWVTFLK